MKNDMLSGCHHLSLELSPYCNLCKEHIWCPNSIRDKTGELVSDKRFIEIIQDATENLGFKGWVSFHFFNEPLLSKDRIQYIIENSQYKRFQLWTNGLLFDRVNLEETDKLVRMFEWIWISDYKGGDVEFFSGLEKRNPGVKILGMSFQMGGWDDRKHIYEHKVVEGPVHCVRPLCELPINFRGDVQLCCQDWAGSYEIGNIKNSLLSDILIGSDYERLLVDLQSSTENVPEVCKRCRNRVDSTGGMLMP
jgi:hypothetical protein